MQSNGKAENAVKTVKRLFTKCKEDGTSEFLALLYWHNTPAERSGVSPAQRLMGRRWKTLLLLATSLLQPSHSIAHDYQAIVAAKAKQSFYYDRHTHPLSKLAAKAKQSFYYDRHIHPLSKLAAKAKQSFYYDRLTHPLSKLAAKAKRVSTTIGLRIH